MQSEQKGGTLLPVHDHWVACPGCTRNKRLLKIRPDTEARRFVAYCRSCKREIILDIDKGERVRCRLDTDKGESVKRHGQ